MHFTRMLKSIPSVLDRDYSSFVLSHVQEYRLCKIKVLQRRITPSSSIVRESAVWRAKVCCSHSDGSRETPLDIHTFDLKASSTSEASVEQRSTQGSCVRTITLAIKISISASSSCITHQTLHELT